MKKLLVFLFLLYSCKQEALDPSLGMVKGATNGIAWEKPQIRSTFYFGYCSPKKIDLRTDIPIGPGLNSIGINILHIPPIVGTYKVSLINSGGANCSNIRAGLYLSNYDAPIDQVYVLEKPSFNNRITVSRVDTVANIMEGNYQILFGDSENKERVLPDTVLVTAEFKVPITRLDL